MLSHDLATGSVRALGLALAIMLIMPTRAAADQDDPPSRVARLAYAEGSVSFQPGGTDDWVAAPLNRPLTTGDKLWSDRDSRVELQLDGSLLRLSSNTALSFLNLDNDVTQIQLTAGTLLVRVRRLDDNETYEIDTPNLAFSVLRPGLYRLTVDDSGNATAIRVRSGQGEVTGGGSAYSVRANEDDVFSGTEELAEATQPYPQDDSFDAWSADRDSRWERSASARYVSPDVVGYEDLDDYGAWQPTPDYGYVWFPGGVAVGWAPYHYGHWAYIAPWGYTWVDDQPWGFAPFHYGRWVSINGAWGWVPCPPRPPGGVYVRPVYAPALVAWVGVGAGIAWFALGPREVFVPSYPVSRSYINNINVSNTTVNTTVVNNIYNTTIVNKAANPTNVTYVNRRVPGAVAATTSQAFITAQPVSRNRVAVDQRAVAAAPVGVFAPATVPTKQAVLGAGRVGATRPPAAVQSRAVVARTLVPPPPPTFERRQDAIRSNGGKPLSVADVRQIQIGTSQRVSPVRVAPPATPVPTQRPAQAETPANETPRAGAPPGVSANQRTNAVVHPSDVPAAPRPPSPAAAGSVLERQHLQEQQQLRAQQDAERQRVQQQQELAHQQLLREQADEAKRQQLEQQHQRETEELARKHAQELEQLQQRQQEQRRQQESQTKPGTHKEPPSPPR